MDYKKYCKYKKKYKNLLQQYGGSVNKSVIVKGQFRTNMFFSYDNPLIFSLTYDNNKQNSFEFNIQNKYSDKSGNNNKKSYDVKIELLKQTTSITQMKPPYDLYIDFTKNPDDKPTTKNTTNLIIIRENSNYSLQEIYLNSVKKILDESIRILYLVEKTGRPKNETENQYLISILNYILIPIWYLYQNELYKIRMSTRENNIPQSFGGFLWDILDNIDNVKLSFVEYNIYLTINDTELNEFYTQYKMKNVSAKKFYFNVVKKIKQDKKNIHKYLLENLKKFNKYINTLSETDKEALRNIGDITKIYKKILSIYNNNLSDFINKNQKSKTSATMYLEISGFFSKSYKYTIKVKDEEVIKIITTQKMKLPSTIRVRYKRTNEYPTILDELFFKNDFN